jgi:hypothetical protein
MIWIAIAVIFTAFALGNAWQNVIRIKENAHTERLKTEIKADQVRDYNEFLSSVNEHMLSDQLSKEFKIITIDGEA